MIHCCYRDFEDEQIDRHNDRQTDRQKERTDGQTKKTKRQRDRQTKRQRDIQRVVGFHGPEFKDEQIDMSRQMDRWTNGQTEKCTD
jgi:hypothetical protein